MVYPRISRKKTTYIKATAIIIFCLLVLMIGDVALTCIAVGQLGADEVNPLCKTLGGLFNFMAVKVTVSIIGILGLFHLGMQYPRRILLCSFILWVMYAGTIIWNTLGLLGFRML